MLEQHLRTGLVFEEYSRRLEGIKSSFNSGSKGKPVWDESSESGYGGLLEDEESVSFYHELVASVAILPSLPAAFRR